MQCPVEDLEAAASLFMASWIELATTPYGSPLDTTKMFWPVAPPRKSHFKAAAKMRAVMLENETSGSIALDSMRGNLPQERNGDSPHSVKIVVGADVEMSVTYTRVVTASALGIFASKLHTRSVKYVIDPLWNALASLSGVQRQVILSCIEKNCAATFLFASRNACSSICQDHYLQCVVLLNI